MISIDDLHKFYTGFSKNPIYWTHKIQDGMDPASWKSWNRRVSNEKSSDFDAIWYKNHADLDLGDSHLIKYTKKNLEFKMRLALF